MSLKVYKSTEELIAAFADYFCAMANKAIREYDCFSVVLSGGSSPRAAFQLLVSQYADKLDWKKIDFFFGDERYVPQTDKESNYLMAKENLFDPLSISPDHIYAVDTSLTPAEAARKYSVDILNYFSKHRPGFDLVILGLGDDAHTASLFPGTTVINETKPYVKEVFVEKLDVNRITMTAPLINQGRQVAFLVYGKNKADAVHAFFEGERNPLLYPSQMIKNDESTEWFLDASAASELRLHTLN
ncbi:MAG: 6-phosphogluconolactonase [Chitinophagaceae bacterium]|nr:6-phosphogluconolactonase [Chitinophagaceae bacterium]